MNCLSKYSLVFTLLVAVFACQTKPDTKTIIIVDKARIESEVIGKNVQLVDVRTPEEYDAGHIDNAVNYNIIDSETFLKQIEDLNKETPVYLYCKMGGRSNRAAELLKGKGFVKIYDYSGGYNDWVSK